MARTKSMSGRRPAYTFQHDPCRVQSGPRTPSRTVYTGTWRRGQLHGWGRMVWSTGKLRTFLGTWHQNRMKKGTLRFRNGDIYVGNIRGRRPHGKGILCSRHGWVYDGAFVHGKKHGEGTEHYLDGGVYKGTFRDGCLVRGTYSMPSDAMQYQGEFYHKAGAQPCFHGRGALCKGGKTCSGQFFMGGLPSRHTCMLCGTSPTAHAFVHGDTAHVGACGACATRMKQLVGNTPPCPICRQTSHLVRLFEA